MWERALSADWTGAPVWFHGDVASGNLLIQERRLSAVIDFGTSGIGAPAIFRSPEETWARGRGWTLWKVLIVAAGMLGSNRLEIERSQRVIAEVLTDHARYN